MSTTKIEFAVQMTCNSCVNKVENVLQNVGGISNVDINLEKESVVIDSNLSTLDLQKLLESTGKKVAVRGFEGSIAAVSILEAGDKAIHGVIRFVQATPQTCIIDGTVDGLKPGEYSISIHECGDITRGCQSVGNVYNPQNSKSGRIYGHIGTVKASNDGRADFRLEDQVIKLSDVIGRSFVLSENTENETGKGLVCGIIARSAGLFQNPKKICACDGVTLWDEVSKPKATL